MQRIVVVGAAGSGKTTFARALAARLRVAHVELDALHWGPRWTPVPSETFRARADGATAQPAWVVDGNYSSVRDLVWARADTLVWLDYPLRVVFARLVRRSVGRIRRREALWESGNRETWRNTLFARDSLLYFAVGQHRRLRQRYPPLLAGEFARLRRFRFRSPREAGAWLDSIPEGGPPP